MNFNDDYGDGYVIENFFPAPVRDGVITDPSAWDRKLAASCLKLFWKKTGCIYNLIFLGWIWDNLGMNNLR